MKKLAILVAAMMILAATACGSTGNIPDITLSPTPASTPEPATPEPPCEHAWVDADCETPETCSKCEETRGAALGHDLKEANYQKPETCLLCGATQGEPLTPGFAKHGIEPNAVLGVGYPYVTVTWDNNDLETIGEVTLTEMYTASSYDGYEARDGYEFIVAKFILTFEDDNAHSYSARWGLLRLDYYTYDPEDETTNFDDAEEGDIPGFIISSANYYGEDLEVQLAHTSEGWWSGGVISFSIELVFYVPVGYDGMVVWFYNAKNSESLTSGDMIDDDTVIYRIISDM